MSPKEIIEYCFANAPMRIGVLRVGFPSSFRGWGVSTLAYMTWKSPSDLGEAKITVNYTYEMTLDHVHSNKLNLT